MKSKAVLLISGIFGGFIGYKLYKNRQNKWRIDSEYSMGNFEKILNVSVPGKIILSGEHACVYGYTCIATAINKRINMTLYHDNSNIDRDNHYLILKFDQFLLKWELQTIINAYKTTKYLLLKPKVIELIAYKYSKKKLNEWIKSISQSLFTVLFMFDEISIILAYLIKINLNKSRIKNIIIEIKSDIPIGVGLGSSAAFSTSLVTLLYKYGIYLQNKNDTNIVKLRENIDNICENDYKIINKISYEIEKIYHGKPSGIDNTTTLYGKYIQFNNKHKYEIINCCDKNKLKLLVINTGIIGETKILVNNVRELKNKYNNIVTPIFESIQNISNNIIHNLKNNNINLNTFSNNIDNLFQLNHGLLISIGINHYIISEIYSICLRHGLSMKITGAGGGGCVIVNVTILNDIKLNDFIKLIHNHGYSNYLIETGQKGCCVSLSRKH